MVTDPGEWPADLRPILAEYLARREKWNDEEKKRFGPLMAYPRFYLALNGHLDTTSAWSRGWVKDIAPRLLTLLSQPPSQPKVAPTGPRTS